MEQKDLNILLIRLNCPDPSLGDLSSFCSANWIFCPLLCRLWSDLSNIKGAEKIPMFVSNNNVQLLNRLANRMLFRICCFLKTN